MKTSPLTEAELKRLLKEIYQSCGSEYILLFEQLVTRLRELEAERTVRKVVKE